MINKNTEVNMAQNLYNFTTQLTNGMKNNAAYGALNVMNSPWINTPYGKILDTIYKNEALNTKALTEILEIFKTNIESNKNLSNIEKKQALFSIQYSLSKTLNINTKYDSDLNLEDRKLLAADLFKIADKMQNTKSYIDIGAANLLQYLIICNMDNSKEVNNEIDKLQIKTYLEESFSLSHKDYLAMKTYNGLNSAKKTTIFVSKTLGKLLLAPVIFSAQVYYRKFGTHKTIKDALSPHVGGIANTIAHVATTSNTTKDYLHGIVDQVVIDTIYDSLKSASDSLYNAIWGNKQNIRQRPKDNNINENKNDIDEDQIHYEENPYFNKIKGVAGFAMEGINNLYNMCAKLADQAKETGIKTLASTLDPNWEQTVYGKIFNQTYNNKELNTDSFKIILDIFKTSIDNSDMKEHEKIENLFAIKYAFSHMLNIKYEDGEDYDFIEPADKEKLTEILFKITDKIQSQKTYYDVGAANLLRYLILNNFNGNIKSTIDTKAIKQHLKDNFTISKKDYLAMKTRHGLKTAKDVSKFALKTLGHMLLAPVIFSVQMYYRKIGTHSVMKEALEPHLGSYAQSGADFMHSHAAMRAVHDMVDKKVSDDIYKGIEDLGNSIFKKLSNMKQAAVKTIKDKPSTFLSKRKPTKNIDVDVPTTSETEEKKTSRKSKKS